MAKLKNLQTLADTLNLLPEQAREFLVEASRDVEPFIDAASAFWALRLMGPGKHTPQELADYLCKSVVSKFKRKRVAGTKESTFRMSKTDPIPAQKKISSSSVSASKTPNVPPLPSKNGEVGEVLLKFFSSLDAEDRKLVDKISKRLAAADQGGLREALILMNDLQQFHPFILKNDYMRGYLPWVVKVKAHEGDLDTRSIAEFVLRVTGNYREVPDREVKYISTPMGTGGKRG